MPRKDRNSWSRERVCASRGRTEAVRKDNASTVCRSCAGRSSGAKGLATIHARAQRSTCLHCGATRKGRFKFCSRGCKRQATSVERACETCGKPFRVARSAIEIKRNAAGRFCSRDCYADWLKKPDHGQLRGSGWDRTRRAALARWVVNFFYRSAVLAADVLRVGGILALIQPRD